MKFCSDCGAPVSKRIPENEDRPRFVCDSCGMIHYRNPKVVVGCLPEKDGRVLLCRRAIEPRLGFWTLPAGFLEVGETLAQGAARETLEETGARVDSLEPYALLDLVHSAQVYVMFRARLGPGPFGPTRESLECRLYALEEIPWEDLAFSSIRMTLEYYVRDVERGGFSLHQGIVPSMGLTDFSSLG